MRSLYFALALLVLVVTAPCILVQGRGHRGHHGVHGDPLFSGFDGSAFFFTGSPNKTYNILSTESCQLNAYFVDAELEIGSHLAEALGGGASSTAPNGTFIQALAFQYGSQSIVTNVNREGILTSLLVNGADVLTASDTTFQLRLSNDITVEYEKFRPWYGQSVNITSPDFDMIIYPTIAHQDETDAHVRGHLNAQVLSVHITPDEVDYVHGILGQTLRSADPSLLGGGVGANVTDAAADAVVTHFTGQGSEADYQVSGLFARDFAFNQLADHEPVLKLITKHLRKYRKAL